MYKHYRKKYILVKNTEYNNKVTEVHVKLHVALGWSFAFAKG